MNKSLSAVIFLLGITTAPIPVYASPTNKKITLTCNSFAPNVITATATVTLCDDTPAPNLCTGQIFVCPTQFACDSSGVTATSSMADSCSTPFKVGAVSADETYVDDAGTPHEVTQSAPAVIQPWFKGGKFGFVSTQVSTNGDNDTATLEIK